jgi:hypothetical protein
MYPLARFLLINLSISVFQGCKRIDFAVFQHKVGFQVDGMVPGSKFRELFCFLFIKNVSIGHQFWWYHFVECLGFLLLHFLYC